MKEHCFLYYEETCTFFCPEIYSCNPYYTLCVPRHAKSQPAKRHSNRKRKANQSQPTSSISDPRVKEGCQVTETLLGVTTEAVMIGLTDGELQLELAQWAAAFAETGELGANCCILCIYHFLHIM